MSTMAGVSYISKINVLFRKYNFSSEYMKIIYSVYNILGFLYKTFLHYLPIQNVSCPLWAKHSSS